MRTVLLCTVVERWGLSSQMSAMLRNLSMEEFDHLRCPGCTALEVSEHAARVLVSDVVAPRRIGLRAAALLAGVEGDEGAMSELRADVADGMTLDGRWMFSVNKVMMWRFERARCVYHACSRLREPTSCMAMCRRHHNAAMEVLNWEKEFL